jgi:uncharacterized glyoxalase superfamily protein PhnB
MSAAAQMRAVSPILLVSDVVAAAAYYADALGFRSPRLWGEPPMFCIPERDGLSVMLNQVGAGDSFRPNADYDGRFDAYFYVSDADALYAEFQANGADIVCEPEDQPYLMREFQVRDPDGHLLAFGHDISGTASNV